MENNKIVCEIHRERHRLVRGRKPKKASSICSKCSLQRYCTKIIGSPCIGNYDYFVKEKKEVKNENEQ